MTSPSLRSLARRLSEPWPAAERARRRSRCSMRVDGDHIWIPFDTSFVKLRPDGSDAYREARKEPALWQCCKACGDSRPAHHLVSGATHSPHVEADGFWQHRRSDSTEQRLSVWRGSRDRVRASEQSLVQGLSSATQRRHPRSWMPSISGIGPIALRWAPTVEQGEPEPWQTYEAIREACEWDPERETARFTRWAVSIPAERLDEAIAAQDGLRGARTDEEMREWLAMPTGRDAYARALAARLAPQPRVIPAAVKHIGSLPRNRKTRRERRWARRDGWIGIISQVSRSNRTILGILASRYTPRRPDGSYNRNDARRWMRRFRAVALIASDALEQSCDRLRAIETLAEVVGLEDAVRLTERPAANRVLISVDGTVSSTVLAGVERGAVAIDCTVAASTPVGTLSSLEASQ